MKELSSFLVLVGLGYVLYLGFTNFDRVKQVGAVLNGTPDVYKKPEKEPVRPDDPVATARELAQYIKNNQFRSDKTRTKDGKTWVYCASVTSVRYDVKKTDSLISPVVAEVAVSHRWYWETEDGATRELEDTIFGPFKATYGWEVVGGTKMGWKLGPDVYNQNGNKVGVDGHAFGILRLLPTAIGGVPE